MKRKKSANQLALFDIAPEPKVSSVKAKPKVDYDHLFFICYKNNVDTAHMSTTTQFSELFLKTWTKKYDSVIRMLPTEYYARFDDGEFALGRTK